MSTNPDDWWLRRRLPPANPGDAWSGGGGAYRKWMGAAPARHRPALAARLARAARAIRHGRRGGPLTFVVAISAAVLFAVPLAWAGRWHPCAAAEVALVDEAVGRGSRFLESKRRVANWTGPDGKLFSHGRVGRQIASEEHPGWPSLAGCTALFWRVRSEGASFGGVRIFRFAPAIARR